MAGLCRTQHVHVRDLRRSPLRHRRRGGRWDSRRARIRTALKNRIHATLLAFGHPCPASDLFGTGGRELLGGLALPEPWAGDVTAAVHLIDQLDHQSPSVSVPCDGWAPITGTSRC